MRVGASAVAVHAIVRPVTPIHLVRQLVLLHPLQLCLNAFVDLASDEILDLCALGLLQPLEIELS